MDFAGHCRPEVVTAELTAPGCPAFPLPQEQEEEFLHPDGLALSPLSLLSPSLLILYPHAHEGSLS